MKKYLFILSIYIWCATSLHGQHTDYAKMSSLVRQLAIDQTLQRHQAVRKSPSPLNRPRDKQPEHVLDLEREVFTVNGTFDAENIYEGAVVPLQNEEGTRFMGRILEVNDKQVKVDLNHPLAGKTLNFKGKVIENREATNEEIAAMVNQMAGGCGCGGHSEGGCCCGGCGSSDDNGCGCGH